MNKSANSFFDGCLLGARTTEVVLEGIRVKGRKPGNRALSRVMMAIPKSSIESVSVNCNGTADAVEIKGFRSDVKARKQVSEWRGTEETKRGFYGRRGSG